MEDAIIDGKLPPLSQRAEQILSRYEEANRVLAQKRRRAAMKRMQKSSQDGGDTQNG